MPICRVPSAMLGVTSALLGMACESVWNAGNRDRAAADVVQLLAPAVANVRPQCSMIGTTRDLTCEFSASAEDVSSIVRGLSLRPVEAGDVAASPLEARARNAALQCSLGSAIASKRTRLFGIDQRPEELRLSNGSAFEFLLLFHDPATSRVCIALSYAYG